MKFTNKHPRPGSDGIRPSYLNLPCDSALAGTLLADYLCRRFPYVPRETWLARLAAGGIFDSQWRPLAPDAPFVPGGRLFYYREAVAADEPEIPFQEEILYTDGHLLAVDKPHFLPVVPSGRFLRETLLTRLRLRPELQDTDPDEIAPLHRIDKDTAGVVLFCRRRESRSAYQMLFQERRVEKSYEALAAARTGMALPLHIRSRIERGHPFFLMCETAGAANAHTVVEDVQDLGGGLALYRLRPISGKKHQLRVHMASLGLPILNDPLYPVPLPDGLPDYAKPLKLLARSIAFTDPFTGEKRHFESRRML
ncbi:Ribosomal large subunit pseudouridine synthase A [Kingella potus]|uniref:Ribosomal large subunit pseudouridine synthase A n=1 Tax=Kingella potus TaxID=265175 RepID=A0A377QYF9_9NEIS|nr:pseudouridine synthase [Kingella potus]STR00032.1 Ribosomal large subunit pseudouridine synthase A [Kingella potus]